ncbi:MAG: DNA mismatch repair endonuclease MutL [Deltaproteobacteria bacterium]|jgi:DNA mismatch repair protein MutL|nr:DNA mismatch repair endonuclease MutL [Deltaproteobacteria bacterium]
MASRIKVLPENLINQIAAGEIVERPASILKELLENSLDSGATRLTIECEAGGKSLIRISDDGCGMSEEELSECLERHATSKLNADSDLMNIHTLGFRGEALPSISSVSRMSITSSTDDKGFGHKITVIGGKVYSLNPAPFNRGTMVEVKDLFFNVPARRKFLKTTKTEEGHLVEIAERYALGRPDISLKLIADGRELVYVDSKNDFNARLSSILGQNFLTDMRAFTHAERGIKIKAYLSGPGLTERTASSLHIYVLGRPVKDRLLIKAVTSGYGRTLQPGRYPLGLVFVEIDPTEVDVNVHPAKTEVRFRNSYSVFSAVETAVNKAISSSSRQIFASRNLVDLDALPTGDALPSDLPEDDEGRAPSDKLTPSWENQLRDSGAFYQGLRKDFPYLQGRAPRVSITSGGQREFPNDSLFEKEPTVKGQKDYSPGIASGGTSGLETGLGLEGFALRPLAQLGKTYILSQGEDGLVITDQHAAHERILFNHLKKELKAQGLPSKQLLIPETMELSLHEKVALEWLAKELMKLGFILEPFGETTWLLKGIPALLELPEGREALVEILDGAKSSLKKYDGGGMDGALKEISESWLHSIACRAAIKAGHSLTITEMERLLEDMLENEEGAYCPHGRPSSITISFKELERKFGRS